MKDKGIVLTFISCAFILFFSLSLISPYGYGDQKNKFVTTNVNSTTVYTTINGSVGSVQCAGTDRLSNVSVTATGITGVCSATGTGGTYNATYALWAFNQSDGSYNISYATWNATQNYTGTQCQAGNYSYGYYQNGTPLCRSDVSGGTGGGMDYTNVAMLNETGINSSINQWNYTAGPNITISDTRVIAINGTSIKEWLDTIYQAIGSAFITSTQANNTYVKQSDINNTISQEGVRIGFNSTYNSSYESTYNASYAANTGGVNSSTANSTYVKQSDVNTTISQYSNYTAGTNITISNRVIGIDVTALKAWLDTIYQAIGSAFITSTQANNTYVKQSDINNTISQEGVRIGFNSTYNSSYESTYNVSYASGSNSSWNESMANVLYAKYNFTTNNFNGSGNFTTTGSGQFSWIDKLAQDNPPGTPLSYVLRLWVDYDAISGFSTYRYKDDTGMVRRIADNVFIGKNIGGSLIPKGSVVYSCGSSGPGAYPLLCLAKADSLTTMPSIGIVIEDVSDGGYGRVMSVGVLENIDTNAWDSNAPLYVSDSIAGNLTMTKPLTPNLTQEIGTVLIKSATVGKIELVARSLTGNEFGTINNFVVVGNVTAKYFFGDGSQLTGLTATGGLNSSTANDTYVKQSDVNTTISQYSNYTAGSNITITNRIIGIDVTALKNWLDTIYQAIGSAFITSTQANNTYVKQSDVNGTISFEGVRIGFNSTYNITYDSWVGNYTAFSKYWYNMSSNSIYNISYDSWIGNYSAFSKYWYNMTYGGSTYNATYAANQGNASWNQTYANTLYQAIGDYLSSTIANNTYVKQSDINTTISQEGVRIGFNSTYNITYAGAVNNDSYLTTYNATYAANAGGINSSTANSTYVKQSDVNGTVSFEGVRIGFNSTYNVSYAGSLNNASYLTTYNASYAAGSNSSWNESRGNSLYSNWTSTQNYSGEDCQAGNYTYGYNQNGTPKCRNDLNSGGAGMDYTNLIMGNTSLLNLTINQTINLWNYTVNDGNLTLVNRVLSLNGTAILEWLSTQFTSITSTILNSTYVRQSDINLTINQTINLWNATFGIFNYNHSLAIFNMYNGSWSSTYNATYAAGGNSSWNETRAGYIYLTNASNINLLTVGGYNLTSNNLSCKALSTSNITVNGFFNGLKINGSTYNASYASGANASWNETRGGYAFLRSNTSINILSNGGYNLTANNLSCKALSTSNITVNEFFNGLKINGSTYNVTYNTWGLNYTSNLSVTQGIITPATKKTCLNGATCTMFICANSTSILISNNGGMTC